MSDLLDLWDYRRRVAAMYAEVRNGGVGEATWQRWRTARDSLFANHPQTPLDDPNSFEALPYFGYDPAWRTVARFVPDEPNAWGEFSRIGRLDFEIGGSASSLPVFWLEAYGGGVFVPFRDLTNGRTTYGGGRYILDTVKGADLGHDDHSVILDFNYAYHPSCVHSYRWACPLAPPESEIGVAVEAGERIPESDT